MNKKFGFTLAEVLITLGIIGVVAAMTIPTLIQNTNSVKFATQFKKDISTLSQAALMAQAQYDTDYGSTTVKCGSNTTGTGDNTVTTGTAGGETLATGTDASICGILNTTLAGKTYLGLGSAVKSASDSTKDYTWGTAGMKTLSNKLNSMHVYTLADGSLIGVPKDGVGCSLEPGAALNSTVLQGSGGLVNCVGFIDVNGTALPNKEVQCSGDTGQTPTTVLDPSTPCTVTNKASDIGDIFPIVYHDGTVEPASNAAKAVLTRGK